MSNVLKVKHSISDSFIGDGLTSTFILFGEPVEIQSVKVDNIDVTYTLKNKNITFTETPANEAKISVNYIGWSPIHSISGKDGKSAYEYAVAGGYEGTEKEFYTAIGNVANKQDIITANSVLKADGKGVVSNAVPGTDYVVPEGNVATATKLAESKNIVIGNATKSFDGSSDISYTLDEIGVAKLVNGKVPASQLPMAATNIDYWVSNSGNDETGNGTLEKPFATITYALSRVPRDLNINYIHIRLLNGTYDEKLSINGFKNGFLYIQAHDETNPDVKINSAQIINCDYLEFRNITFNGNYTYSESPKFNSTIRVAYNSYVVFYYCDFIGIDNTTDFAITCEYNASTYVRNCTFNTYYVPFNSSNLSQILVYSCSGNNNYLFRCDVSTIYSYDNANLKYTVADVQQKNGGLIVL